MKAGSRYRPTVAPGKTSCEAEPCYALPMQPGEKWSCPGRCQWMRCSYDDPPDVNCRAGYPTRRRTISLIAITLIDLVHAYSMSANAVNDKWPNDREFPRKLCRSEEH